MSKVPKERYYVGLLFDTKSVEILFHAVNSLVEHIVERVPSVQSKAVIQSADLLHVTVAEPKFASLSELEMWKSWVQKAVTSTNETLLSSASAIATPPSTESDSTEAKLETGEVKDTELSHGHSQSDGEGEVDNAWNLAALPHFQVEFDSDGILRTIRYTLKPSQTFALLRKAVYRSIFGDDPKHTTRLSLSGHMTVVKFDTEKGTLTKEESDAIIDCLAVGTAPSVVFPSGRDLPRSLDIARTASIMLLGPDGLWCPPSPSTVLDNDKSSASPFTSTPTTIATTIIEEDTATSSALSSGSDSVINMNVKLNARPTTVSSTQEPSTTSTLTASSTASNVASAAVAARPRRDSLELPSNAIPPQRTPSSSLLHEAVNLSSASAASSSASSLSSSSSSSNVPAVAVPSLRPVHSKSILSFPQLHPDKLLPSLQVKRICIIHSYRDKQTDAKKYDPVFALTPQGKVDDDCDDSHAGVVLG